MKDSHPSDGADVAGAFDRGAESYLFDDFESFYAAEYGRVLAVTAAVAADMSLAEDIAQQAFVVAYRRWSHIRHYDRPGAFVRRVALNLAASRFRRKLRELTVLERLFHFDPGMTVGEPTPTAFWETISTLPARQRQVLALRYVEDYSIEEIAAVLHIAAGSVKAHLHAARHNVARQLNIEPEDPT